MQAEPNGVVTLLTDFGTRDPFVGVVKGVMLARFPAATFVDLTHEIEPQRVSDATFWLGQSTRYFAPGTVHLVVVDPGVGSQRAELVLRADGQYFVGPDNGIFEVVMRRAQAFEARAIRYRELGLSPPSRTFHGRDVFAPVAALLASRQVAFEAIGPLQQPVVTAAVPEAVVGESSAQGEVVVIDRFGNLVTNLEGDFLDRGTAQVELTGRTLPVVHTYADVARGALAALRGSFGQLEIAERDGSAAHTLWAKRGTPVRVSW